MGLPDSYGPLPSLRERAANPAAERDRLMYELLAIDPFWTVTGINAVQQGKATTLNTKKLNTVQQLLLIVTAVIVIIKVYQHREQIIEFVKSLSTKVSGKLGLD